MNLTKAEIRLFVCLRRGEREKASEKKRLKRDAEMEKKRWRFTATYINREGLMMKSRCEMGDLLLRVGLCKLQQIHPPTANPLGPSPSIKEPGT